MKSDSLAHPTSTGRPTLCWPAMGGSAKLTPVALYVSSDNQSENGSDNQDETVGGGRDLRSRGSDAGSVLSYRRVVHEAPEGRACGRDGGGKVGFTRATGHKAGGDQRLPSEKRKPRGSRRPDPLGGRFERVAVPLLERNPKLRAVAVFEELCRLHPELPASTRRTVERRVREWKALHGPEREVVFVQKHRPGRRGYSDFTAMAKLGVTVAGEPLRHMLYRFRLAVPDDADAQQSGLGPGEAPRGVPRPGPRSGGPATPSSTSSSSTTSPTSARTATRPARSSSLSLRAATTARPGLP